MAQQFKFNILTGTDAQTKYDAITTKEPFTFYLLQTGVGYLGEKKLFDAASLENTEVTLTGKFFRAVASHVITQADLDNVNLSKPNGTVVGDAGILFTADNNDSDDGDELKYFVPVKIPETINTIDGDNPAVGVPTVAAVVNYITQVLGNYVTFEVDGVPGSATADGSVCYPGVYSTDEVRIGTWINGKPIYRKVFECSGVPTKGTWFTLPNSVISNIEAIMNLFGQIAFVDGITLNRIPYGDSSSFFDMAYNKNNGITVYTNYDAAINRPFTIVAEYTKTTDNGGT